jgi:CheY-like chemotaxis protein
MIAELVLASTGKTISMIGWMGAQIILLLVSADFLASDYCYDVEMKRAMERHASGEARVIPIILRPCDWHVTPFAKVQALPKDGRPVIKWRDQDTAFSEITRGIRDVVSSLYIKNLESKIEKLKKVIVVDDERVIADTLAIIFKQNGFEALSAYTGTEAVEIAEREQPWLIVSDVIMPEMNGIEAAIRIRSKLPHCRILLFSGQAATAELLEKARAQGHEFEILPKPVHPQDLFDRIREDGKNLEGPAKKSAAHI